MNSTKTASPTRSSQSHRASRNGTSASHSTRRSTASRSASSAPSVKSSHPHKVALKASKPTVAQRVTKAVKSKTGLAIAAGVVLAGAAGLIRKYRTAH